MTDTIITDERYQITVIEENVLVIKITDIAVQELGGGTVSSVNGVLPGLGGNVVLPLDFAPTLTADENYLTVAEKAALHPVESESSIGALVNSAAVKSPADADKFAIWNSVGGLFAACTWTGIKAALLTYFSTLFLSKTADVIEVTGTTATVLTSWNGKRVRFTNAAAVTLTIPATAGFTAGFQCSLRNDSANAIDVSFSGTVVASGTKIAQKKGATLRMDDVFRAEGGLS